MMGLESPGSAPDPLSLSPRKVNEGLAGVRNALRTCCSSTCSGRSRCRPNLRDDSISNTTGIMMFFLARSGRQILAINPITVPVSGGMETRPPCAASR